MKLEAVSMEARIPQVLLCCCAVDVKLTNSTKSLGVRRRQQAVLDIRILMYVSDVGLQKVCQTIYSGEGV